MVKLECSVPGLQVKILDRCFFESPKDIQLLFLNNILFWYYFELFTPFIL